MTDATQLLREYARHGSEAAFRELVARYTDFVYSVALRRAGGDSHLAEDIVQLVFTDLATQSRRGRGPLAGGPCALGGWLHRHTCFVAANLRRADHRRQVREQQAVEMNSPNSASDASWQQLAPVLDETLNELEPQDRDALLLRFYERRDLRAVGQALGMSEDAAQKRVSRALERLRHLLAARGVVLGLTGLAGLLAERAVQAAPTALAGRVSKTAAAAGAGLGLGWLGWLLATAKAKLAAGLVVAGLVTLPLVWQFSGRSPAPDVTSGGAGAAQTAMVSGGASGTPNERAAVNTPASARPADSERDPEALVLTFLSADTGQPVPNVAVDYWCWNGTAVERRTLHGTRAGVCEVRFPRHTATQLQLTSQCEGFADTRLEWRPDRGEQVPFEYTLRLGRAVPIGGVVVDPDGQPVAGAKVGFNHEENPAEERRPESHAFGWIEVESGSDGRWQINRIAEEMIRRVHGSARHPDYLEAPRVFVARNLEAEQQLRAGEYVFQLGRAAVVTGVVVDQTGAPIPNAKVSVGVRTSSERQTTTTDAEGAFRLGGAHPTEALVTAEARGFVPLTLTVNLTEKIEPLTLVLRPGKTLRFRVVDQGGHPIQGVWFVLESSKATPHTDLSVPPPVRQPDFGGYTDAEGRAVWEGAPDQEFFVALVKSGYMRRDEVQMRPAEQEHLVVLQPALTIAGTVSDAVTAKPISNFRILCGWPETFGNQMRPRWSSSDRHQLTFSGGTFRHSLEEPLIYGISNPGYVFKFEAEGYAPYVTRVVKPDEGEVEFAVTLQPAESVTVSVLLPDGRPAARCDVGFVLPGAQLTLRFGGLEVRDGARLVTTDAAGQFHLPVDEAVTMVIAAHPQGFAMAPRTALKTEPVLPLQPWARVEGRAWSKGRPAPGREFLLTPAVPEIWPAFQFEYSNYRVTSDARGEFVFERVPPIELQLVELILFETPPPQRVRGWSHNPLETIAAKPAQTAFVEVGKDTVAVRLRLCWPDSVMPQPDGGVAFATIATSMPRPPAEIRGSPQAYAEWSRRPEAQAARLMTRAWPLAQVSDGAWEAQDVRPGQYVVRVGLRPASGDVADHSPAKLFEAPVVVPAGGEGELMDLGEVTLQPVP
jgi:RNA polymerase sigma factor (sigma-70 family)